MVRLTSKDLGNHKSKKRMSVAFLVLIPRKNSLEAHHIVMGKHDRCLVDARRVVCADTSCGYESQSRVQVPFGPRTRFHLHKSIFESQDDLLSGHRLTRTIASADASIPAV